MYQQILCVSHLTCLDATRHSENRRYSAFSFSSSPLSPTVEPSLLLFAVLSALLISSDSIAICYFNEVGSRPKIINLFSSLCCSVEGTVFSLYTGTLSWLGLNFMQRKLSFLNRQQAHWTKYTSLPVTMMSYPSLAFIFGGNPTLQNQPSTRLIHFHIHCYWSVIPFFDPYTGFEVSVHGSCGQFQVWYCSFLGSSF